MSSSKSYRAPVLADVAKAAGVSVPTVSRVLNGTKNVAPELARRVHAAVKELGYRPNSAARSLRLSQPNLISIIAEATTSSYGYANTLSGIETAAQRAGMSVSITIVSSDEDESVMRAVDLALSQPIGGAIVLEFNQAGIKAAKALPASLPVVAAGGGLERTDGSLAALIDEAAGGRQVTEFLLRQGHRTVHHIAGPTGGKVSGRTEGWRTALQDAGAEVPAVMSSEWDALSGYRWGERIAGRDDVTAVFCGNDEIALGVMRALADRGIDVPGDVSIAGFDGQPLVSLWRPSLTTVEQDFEDLGTRAFDLLSQQLQGKGDLRTSVVEPQLVVRESTAPPRR
ncbi:LacI family DNA-binding transcriptional regulator [Glycomyces terrestris]|uniref:LacI family transcriptional regulator n=1 Tax=Glycomyces terrestris TaxID=2493553 RepID=A0A426URF4_9ACTN|nr:LacI family DNA-binding transcriptional regulator [Glycomyces terrestris]RRR95626.1 LacI family transcriptional regulator [Glycomyces terrestris]